jgi:hypothetical protein
MIPLTFRLPSPNSPNYAVELDIELRKLLVQMAIEINKTSGSYWNGFHPIMGNYHLWIDSTGDLRIKSSSPTSDTDGQIVGLQS